MKLLKGLFHGFAASVVTGFVMASDTAHAQDGGFNDITGNIVESISDIPGLITGLAYLIGLLLAVLGIMKIKDHVEKPDQTPLQVGAIRLAAGGAFFALGIITNAMFETIGDESAAGVAKVDRVSLGLN